MGKHLQTAAALACTKTLLMVFNFVFWITGIVILAVGIYMEVELYKYMTMSTDFSETASYVLIGTGTLIILMGMLACCCTVKGQPVLLFLYGGFLAIVFVMIFGTGLSIYAYRENLTDGFDKGLTRAMQHYRNDTDHLAVNFDRMQQALKCCGNHNPDDWLNMHLPTPPSCCKVINCNPENYDEIFTQGCYTKVTEFLNSNIGIVAGTAVGIAFFPIIGVILSCGLASIINKTQYEQMA